MEKDILELIKSSKVVLTFAHLGPDLDSVSSTLFVANLINSSLENVKAIPVVTNGVTDSMGFLNGVENLYTGTIEEAIEEFEPQLLIGLDGSDPKRFTMTPEVLSKKISDNSIKCVIIDHHASESSSEIADIYINNNVASTTEELYRIFHEVLGLPLYDKYYLEIGAGIFGDTGLFIYPMYNPTRVLSLFAKLLAEGLVVEDIVSSISLTNKVETDALSILLGNLKYTDDYAYTYLTFDDAEKVGIDVPSLKKMTHKAVDSYVRNNKGRWGFLIYPDLSDKTKTKYRGSFRSVNGVVNTLVFAKKLNGGGHEPASGFEVVAKNHKEALAIVLQVVKDNLDSARLF